MGKSIRSKVKKAHRSEFRKTVGEVAAQSFMSQTQAKLQECLAKGQGSGESISKVANLLGGHVEDDEDDSDMETDAPAPADLKVAKKKAVVKATKKHAKTGYAAGQTGATRARLAVSKRNKRGQTKRGFVVKKRAPTKKRGSKLAKF